MLINTHDVLKAIETNDIPSGLQYEHTMPGLLDMPDIPGAHLRHVAYSDCEQFYRLVTANRNHLGSYLGWAKDIDLPGIFMRLERNLWEAARDMGMAYWIIDTERQTDDAICGFVRLAEHSSNFLYDVVGPSATLGYWLRQDAQGKGLMRHAVCSLTNYARERWGIVGVVAEIQATNVRSQQVMRSLAAVPYGTIPVGRVAVSASHQAKDPEASIECRHDMMGPYTQYEDIEAERWHLFLKDQEVMP